MPSEEQREKVIQTVLLQRWVPLIEVAVTDKPRFDSYVAETSHQ